MSMFSDLVNLRQSTRKYIAKPIEREDIEKCIEAARLAPSACNSQPWHFIVIDDPELKNKIAEKACTGLYSMNSFAKEAPVIVAVVTEKSRFVAKLGGFFRGMQYNLIDIGIACEHLVLQAAEIGISSCWIGWFNERAVKKILNLSRKSRIDILITLGYPEVSFIREKKRMELKDILTYNKVL